EKLARRLAAHLSSNTTLPAAAACIGRFRRRWRRSAPCTRDADPPYYHISDDLLRRITKADGPRPGAIRTAAQAAQRPHPHRDRYGVLPHLRRRAAKLRRDAFLPVLRARAVPRVMESREEKGLMRRELP